MMQEKAYKEAYRFLQEEMEDIISRLRAIRRQAEQISQGQETPPRKTEYRID